MATLSDRFSEYLSEHLLDDRPRALVTGICGFTGTYVAAELEAAGYRVIGLTNVAHEQKNWLTVDLLDRVALTEAIAEIEPAIVIHLAAIAFVPYGDEDTLYRTNIVGTRNLLQALAKLSKPPRSVILASSANIYGNADVDVIDEHVLAAPRNDYAVSKLAMEHMAQLWGDRLPILITRPFNYTGIGQSVDYVLPKIVDHFRRGEPMIELGNVDVSRDFWDVRSVAQAYRCLADVGSTLSTNSLNKSVGPAFNICSGRAYSLRDVISFLESLAGYQIEVRINPRFIRTNEIKRLVGTNNKLLNSIGPLHDYRLQETLTWMYQA